MADLLLTWKTLFGALRSPTLIAGKVPERSEDNHKRLHNTATREKNKKEKGKERERDSEARRRRTERRGEREGKPRPILEARPGCLCDEKKMEQSGHLRCAELSQTDSLQQNPPEAAKEMQAAGALCSFWQQPSSFWQLGPATGNWEIRWRR